MRRNFLIGSDPEFFLETYNGLFINAYEGLYEGIIKGTKKQPEKTPYGAIQVDGMALEINTIPTNNMREFSDMVRRGLVDGSTRWSRSNIIPSSLTRFDKDWLLSQDPGSIELGCDPDFNAWRKGEMNPRPDMENPVRTAGGHIHVGYKDPSVPTTDVVAEIEECCNVIKHLDYALGSWSLVMDKAGKERRMMYGKPGAFRPKSYGVEYRVLSNFWIFSDGLRKEAFKRTMAAMLAYDDGLRFYDVFDDIILDLFESDDPSLGVYVGVNKLLLPYMKEVENAAA